MKDWLNWVWIDWEIPAAQRVTDAGALWQALKAYGDPTDPNPAHYVIFRAGLDLLPESKVPEGMMPTPDWVAEKYQEFVATIRQLRPHWLEKKKKRPQVGV